MFTNERLFTIQAFTITRVHCRSLDLSNKPYQNILNWFLNWFLNLLDPNVIERKKKKEKGTDETPLSRFYKMYSLKRLSGKGIHINFSQRRPAFVKCVTRWKSSNSGCDQRAPLLKFTVALLLIIECRPSFLTHSFAKSTVRASKMFRCPQFILF